MTLEARPVTRDHVQALIDLKVRDDQRDLVSPNVKTLAQAAYEPGGHVWGLWDEDTLVGLMAMIDPREYAHFQDGDDREAAYLWRLMVAPDHQGNGYGAQAIGIALRIARDWGCPRLTSSVVDVPHSNLGFYERLGFRWTGRYEEGEKVIMREVDPA